MAFPAGNHKETAGLSAYRVSKTAAFTAGAGTGNVGTFALFTVTGSVIVRIVAECTETVVEGVGHLCGCAGGIIDLVHDRVAVPQQISTNVVHVLIVVFTIVPRALVSS